LEFLKGIPDSKGLAETAYEVAYNLDKSDPLPMIQLGRLHIDSGELALASKEFVTAIAGSPNNPDALYGLLQAALMQKDMKTALWAGQKLNALGTKSPEHLKLLAITYALSGQTDASLRQYDLYAKASGVDSDSSENLKSVLDYIVEKNQRLLAQNENGGNFVKTANPGAATHTNLIANNPQTSSALPNGQNNSPLPSNNNQSNGVAPAASKSQSNPTNSNSKGQTATPVNTAAKVKAGKKASSTAQSNSTDSTDSTDTSSDGSTSSDTSSGSSSPLMQQGSMGGAPMGGGVGSGGGGNGYSAAGQASQKQKWFDCDSKPGLGRAPGGSYGVPVGGTSGDQTLYLEPLPAPCDIKNPPKMAMIDAVLIRTVDALSTSNGVNLLTGLQIFAGGQRTTTTGQMPVNASVIGVGQATGATLNSVSGLISYSMNIANSVNSSAQVVARPTLTAIDRVPSTFYSGAVQTVGLNGGGVSGAQMSNIPTGTSLSITPTFIDNDSMMLDCPGYKRHFRPMI
jgi:hypothetical protein